MRTLRQLEQESKSSYPLGAACLEHNIYVDDIFAGDHDLSQAIKKRAELIAVLKTAGIELGKWAATHAALSPTEVC